jgi:hypothetical protein
MVLKGLAPFSHLSVVLRAKSPAFSGLIRKPEGKATEKDEPQVPDLWSDCHCLTQGTIYHLLGIITKSLFA